MSDLYSPRIGLHISSSRIGRSIAIYKSLTAAWMWKLVLRPRYSFSGHLGILSLQCMSWDYPFEVKDNECCSLWHGNKCGAILLANARQYFLLPGKADNMTRALPPICWGGGGTSISFSGPQFTLRKTISTSQYVHCNLIRLHVFIKIEQQNYWNRQGSNPQPSCFY
jgi:hypothetical protein